MVLEYIWRVKGASKWVWFLGYKIEYLVKIIGRGGRRKTILFYPDRPRLYSTIRQLCHLEGIAITMDPAAPYDACVFWRDDTFCELDDTAREIARSRRMFNAECLDISKKRVDESHKRSFGYSLELDPTTHSGVCVRKSNKNYTHDGLVLQCPLSRAEAAAAFERGYLYFKLINNGICKPNDKLTGPAEDYVQEYRVTYFDGEIPICYIKYRPISIRFSSSNEVVELADADDIFTVQEIANIVAFCRDMQFDCGELDVLRDLTDGRIYIVDANTTPCGPPQNITPEDGMESFRRLGASLLTAF